MTPAGYSGTPLPKKLAIKDGTSFQAISQIWKSVRNIITCTRENALFILVKNKLYAYTIPLPFSCKVMRVKAFKIFLLINGIG